MDPSSAAAADVTIAAPLGDLDQGGRILAEYIWLGPECTDIRCKTKVLDSVPKVPSDLPEWNYDGSSTDQAPGRDSEVLIVPRVIFRDPFRRGGNIMVLCDTYVPSDRSPLDTNTRHECARAMELARDHHPWFGIEQEYTLFQGGKPLGWPVAAARSFGGPTTQLGYPGPQGPYYCSAGADVAFGRAVADAHLKACLFAGVKVSGINAEVMPGQWEFQVGPCEGIQSGDHVTMARYLLMRVGELFNVVVSFDPKPVPGDWNGAGCHTNYSTHKMREAGGYDAIMDAVKKLELRHMDHMERYGEGNERRLTGKHETAPFDQFSWGVANRGASIRIGNQTAQDKRGYLEDRRPSSNMDPYVVTMLLVQTTILDS